jgi:DNA mismatch repair protein MSH4
MSGKSTYLRAIALLSIMAQLGSFVPAAYASLPVFTRVCARTSHADSIEDSASTFALEMREMAAILRGCDERSLVLVDELGRGTSTRDGLAIAVAIAEALIDSRARVWFATHFLPLVPLLSPRPGVLALHMAVSISDSSGGGGGQTLQMHYRLAQGGVGLVHYGLAFARVFKLPATMLETAERVSKELVRRAEIQKGKKGGHRERLRRRKVLMGVKECLEQAREGVLEGESLRGWLIALQGEFVRRMDGGGEGQDEDEVEIAEMQGEDGGESEEMDS